MSWTYRRSLSRYAMAYEDKDFTPNTGSMIPSHTKTQIKNLIHIKGTLSSAIKRVNSRPFQLSAQSYCCSITWLSFLHAKLLSSIVKQNRK